MQVGAPFILFVVGGSFFVAEAVKMKNEVRLTMPYCWFSVWRVGQGFEQDSGPSGGVQ